MYNAKVTAVVKDGASPTLAAHHEYDPYRNVVRSTGTYADANPVRFSTRPLIAPEMIRLHMPNSKPRPLCGLFD